MILQRPAHGTYLRNCGITLTLVQKIWYIMQKLQWLNFLLLFGYIRNTILYYHDVFLFTAIHTATGEQRKSWRISHNSSITLNNGVRIVLCEVTWPLNHPRDVKISTACVCVWENRQQGKVCKSLCLCVFAAYLFSLVCMCSYCIGGMNCCSPVHTH